MRGLPYGTPNYYVQKLYSTNLGTNLLPLTVDGSAKNAENGLYTTASVDRKSGEVILKVVNPAAAPRKIRVDVKGGIAGEGRLLVLASPDLAIENSLDQPTKFAPIEKRVAATSGGFDLTLDGQSMTVLRARLVK